MIQKAVLDTSIIIDGKVTSLIQSGEIPSGAEIIVPIAALDELQAQASKHREEGFIGLEELTHLRELADEKRSECLSKVRGPPWKTFVLRGLDESTQLSAMSQNPEVPPYSPETMSRRLSEKQRESMSSIIETKSELLVCSLKNILIRRHSASI